MRVLVVGAGLSGCTAAQQFAAAGHQVTVMEQRGHVGGHAFDCRDDNGIMVHQYGPHLFHTNDQEVVDYLSRFTAWLPHEHRILSSVNGKFVPVPINTITLRELYGREFTPEEMRTHLEKASIQKYLIQTSEDWLLSTYGPELTDLFFRDYIRKQWGRELDQLHWSVAARIKPRFSDDCRTFTEKFQVIPATGYTVMCMFMLHHKNIRLLLDMPFSHGYMEKYDLTVYTGPIDEFFSYANGHLPYRSLRFVHSLSLSPPPAPTLVFPSKDIPFTRVTDWRQVAGAHKPVSEAASILTEYPTEDGEPMYPVPAEDAAALYAKYEEMAKARKDVLFCGRLGRYEYMNMDRAVRSTLDIVRPYL